MNIKYCFPPIFFVNRVLQRTFKIKISKMTATSKSRTVLFIIFSQIFYTIITLILVFSKIDCPLYFILAEQIASNLSLEIKRMQRRKQLQYPGCPSPPNMSPPHESTSQSSLLDLPSGSSSTSLFNALSPNKKDIPIFTFRQVSMICERMLKDREDQVRQEYNSVLTCKLAGICKHS